MTDQTPEGGQTGRIDIRDEAQCRYWSRHFDVRPRELKAAVRAVGDNVEDVTRYVGELKQSQQLTS